MPGCSYSTPGYRYGFNGKEKEDEVKGGGNAIEFGGRSIYDSRLGRFVSVDPRWRSFPYMSSYCFAANTPIAAVDVNGEGPVLIGGPGLNMGINQWTSLYHNLRVRTFSDNPSNSIGVRFLKGIGNLVFGIADAKATSTMVANGVGWYIQGNYPGDEYLILRQQNRCYKALSLPYWELFQGILMQQENLREWLGPLY